MFVRYKPRPLSFLGIELVSGYRLKSLLDLLRRSPRSTRRFSGGWRCWSAKHCRSRALSPSVRVWGSRLCIRGGLAIYPSCAGGTRENELPIANYLGDALAACSKGANHLRMGFPLCCGGNARRTSARSWRAVPTW